jgi:tetratricopeptide (TPR) repeat protein
VSFLSKLFGRKGNPEQRGQPKAAQPVIQSRQVSIQRSEPRYQIGDKIGDRYQVFQVHLGGMGEVYLCLDLQENYPYALKTFQQRYQSAALRKAFEQEVATWVALEKHPNIVRCFHMDMLDNQPFMVLEWIAGEEGKGADLRGWLRRGPFDLKTALEITIDVVRGLLHAQQKQPGLVHRDLKPENILVAQGGPAKITDFGLAQIVERAGLEVEGDVDRRQSMMRKGGITGTPAYMAPEQWHGEPLDERTDMYAVGCILYEMLTGEWPFQVDFTPTTPQQFQQWLGVMQSKHEGEPPPALPADLEIEMGKVVADCLAKESRQRPASLCVLEERLVDLYRQQFDQSPPTHPQATAFTAGDYNNRGNTYADLQQYEAALADYNRAIELNPKLVEAYTNRGALYADLQQYEQALADYNRAIELNPQFVGAYAGRGLTYHDLQQYEAALADFNRAIELDPKYAAAYSNRGLTYQDLQQYQAALADYDQAIELNPGLTKAYRNRATTYKALQRYDEALADYNRAIELNREFVEAYISRGTTYATLQQYEEALADFGQAIDLDLNDALAYYNRGITYATLQQYKEALADFGQAINLDPNHAQAYVNRGNTYAELQQYEAALRDYTRAIELDPNDALAYVVRGNLYQKLGQLGQALTDYTRAIELDPQEATAYFNLGILLANTGQLHESLSYFDQAERLGFSQANQAMAQVRQRLDESVPTPQTDPAQAAFETFQQSTSPEAMQQAVAQFPFMVQAAFIAVIEQIITKEVPSEYRPVFEQRLDWLKQIAQEQNQ